MNICMKWLTLNIVLFLVLHLYILYMTPDLKRGVEVYNLRIRGHSTINLHLENLPLIQTFSRTPISNIPPLL